MRLIVTILFILAAWKWADWRNWQQYYPTILYFILGNFLYGYLCYNYPLWIFHEAPDTPFLPNDTMISIFLSFTAFPCIILIYLSHFPKTKKFLPAFFYIVICSIAFTGIETFMKIIGNVSHHNGWNMFWSFIFDLVLFSFLKLHQKKPLFTWFLSFIVIFLLCMVFKVPVKSMR